MKPLQFALLLLYIYVGCVVIFWLMLEDERHFGSMIVNSFNTDECNSKKRCVVFPDGCISQQSTECDYLLSYSPSETDDNIFDIELATKRKTDTPSYVAVGFSLDQEMGDEPVSACSFVNNDVSVHLSKNLGKSNTPMEDNPLKLSNGGAENGLLYCKFQQTLNKNSSMNADLPDLTRPYFLFLVRGPVQDPSVPRRIGIHALNQNSPDFPQITKNQYIFSEALSLKPSMNTTRSDGNVSNHESIGDAVAPIQSQSPASADYKLLLVRYHGIIMVVAWLFLLAIGIFSARYMRELWPTTTPMGLKIWFHIHRTLNFIAVVLLVVSTILVFIAKDLSWKGPWFGREAVRNTSLGAIHSLVGLIAVIGAVAQPFIALTRCGMNHPSRPIFNWIHRIVGLAGFVLAAVALFIAAYQFKRYWALDRSWTLASLIVYFVLVIGVVIALEWYRMKYRKAPHPGGFEMKTKDGRQDYLELHSNSSRIDDKKVKQATIGFFAAFVAVVLVFTGIFLGMLWP